MTVYAGLYHTGLWNPAWYTQYGVEQAKYVQIKSIAEVKLHPDFHQPRKTYVNDIALVRLSSKLTLNDAVSPGCIPTSGK